MNLPFPHTNNHLHVLAIEPCISLLRVIYKLPCSGRIRVHYVMQPYPLNTPQDRVRVRRLDRVQGVFLPGCHNAMEIGAIAYTSLVAGLQ